MKRLLKQLAVYSVVCSFGWLCGVCIPSVSADDVVGPAVVSAEPAIINHPTTGWELTKSFVGYVEPGADFLVTFTDGPPINGFSGALWTFAANGYNLASLRAGYGLTDPVSYGTIALDLNGLAHLLPSSVRGLSPGVVNGALAFAYKFVRVGPSFGYDWDDHKPVWGVSIGAALTTQF